MWSGAATLACLQRIHVLTTFRHGLPAPRVLAPENVDVRVFLAGLMIAAFERICHQIAADASFAHVPHELTKDFPKLPLNFLRAFKAWKVPDEAKLTKCIKHALVALYRGLQHLSPHEPEDSKLKMKCNSSISRLRSTAKLQQMAGMDALKAFDKEYAKHGQIETVDREENGV